MSAPGKTRRRATQDRALVTRARIVDGAIRVLAEAGVAGLTHRAVARAGGVSLAATTYHFETKAGIVEGVSRMLLDGYLGAFRRLQDRICAGQETRLSRLDDLVRLTASTALVRDRTRSLAWCELILHGGRNADSRSLTQSWYSKLDSIWCDIGRSFDPAVSHYNAAAAIDLTVGLTCMLHPLCLHRFDVEALFAGQKSIDAALGPFVASGAERKPEAEDAHGVSARRKDMRRKVLEAAIAIIVDEGAAGMSHSRVAEIAGMARSGPSYYFPTIDGLLEAAQLALFERAKARYRSGFASCAASDIDEPRLLDLTTTIYFREALEFGRENIGYYSVWLNAAQNPSLRPAVAASLLDLHRAWSRRIASVSGGKPDPAVPFRMQALFVGKLIRTIVAGTDVAGLSRAREDFAAILTASKAGSN